MRYVMAVSPARCSGGVYRPSARLLAVPDLIFSPDLIFILQLYDEYEGGGALMRSVAVGQLISASRPS